MFTTVAIAAGIGFFTGAALTGVITKMNLAKVRKLELAVTILKQEKEFIKNRLVSMEKARSERLQRKIQQIRSQKPK